MTTKRAFILLFIIFILAACGKQPESKPAASDANQSTAAQPGRLAPTVSSYVPLAAQKGSNPTLTPFVPLAQDTPSSEPPPALEPSPTALPPEITLLFTGVIVPARCVQASIDARGDASYVFDEVRKIIKAADLAVGTLNATISDYPPHTGCIFTYVLVGDSRSGVAMQEAGFDVMSVATNHIKNCGIGDCGDRAFLETLDNLRAVGILPVGAGNNLAEAMRPVVATVKGVRFGIVSLGQIEPMTFATADTPGIAELTEENLRKAIKQARKVSDVVIAMPHMGPEDSPEPTEIQQEFARIAVDAGADLVVGNHTHVVQGMQVIDGVQVFYGLGNFVFDQTWSLDHQQGVILQVKFEGAKYAGYELIPTHVDGDGTVHIATGSEAEEIIQRMEDASIQ